MVSILDFSYRFRDSGQLELELRQVFQVHSLKECGHVYMLVLGVLQVVEFYWRAGHVLAVEHWASSDHISQHFLQFHILGHKDSRMRNAVAL